MPTNLKINLEICWQFFRLHSYRKSSIYYGAGSGGF